MEYQPFGNTGLRASAVGFGAWQLNNPVWGGPDEAARLAAPEMPPARAALAFVLAHREIATVIPGAKTRAQLEANLAAATEPLPAALVAAIHAVWEAELADHPLPW